MKEQDKARIFSQYLDQMSTSDGEIPKEMSALFTIAAWLALQADFPAPPFYNQLEQKLRDQWQAMSHSKGGK